MAESTWSKNTTFHAFMLSLKRSNQFPHHILILQGRVPRCPGLVSRDTALDSRGGYIPVDTVLQGEMFVVSINLQSPAAYLLVPRQNVATNWQWYYLLHASRNQERGKNTWFYCMAASSAKGPRLPSARTQQHEGITAHCAEAAAGSHHPSAAGGAKEGFSPSHSCRLRPGAGEWTGDNWGGVAQIPLKIFPNPRKYLGAAGTMAVCPPVIRHPPECGDTAGTGSSSRSSSLGHGHTTSPALDISGYIMHVSGDNL